MNGTNNNFKNINNILWQNHHMNNISKF
jgi:hypothetical protein